MNRINIEKRENFEEKLKSIGFEFFSLDNPYWDESITYSFNLNEVNEIEKATNELYQMCLEAVQHVIDYNLFDKLHINPKLIPLILRSWEEEEPSVYGRFDFAFNGTDLKMLEFNADTPTSLYEGSVVQWNWLEDKFKDKDQFNSIHDKLIQYWTSCLDYFKDEILHFTCIKDSIEDYTTVEYLRDTANQAGIKTSFLYIEDIGWDSHNKEFIDDKNNVIFNIFKLYPWEWIIEEKFGENIIKDRLGSKWIEPAWKSILSNKGILPILWELFPNNKYLLECYFDSPNTMLDYVSKPIYSREGSNVSIYKNNNLELKSEGDYGEEGLIYQKLADIPNYDNNFPIIGSWIIGGESAGMGIRESQGMITDNLSRFIPHIIEN